MKYCWFAWLIFQLAGSVLAAQTFPASDRQTGQGNGPGISLPPLAAGTFFYGKTGKPFSGYYLLTHLSPRPPFFAPAGMGTRFPAWNAESLPFFCRVEHDWGKRLPFAFKVRLGSVEYVDWLEGKNNWPGH